MNPLDLRDQLEVALSDLTLAVEAERDLSERIDHSAAVAAARRVEAALVQARTVLGNADRDAQADR